MTHQLDSRAIGAVMRHEIGTRRLPPMKPHVVPSGIAKIRPLPSRARSHARRRSGGAAACRLGYLRKRPRPKYPSSARTTRMITMIQIRFITLSLHERCGERSSFA